MVINIDGITIGMIEELVFIAIILDTVLGMLQAIRAHKFNCSFGINGVIRKVAMIVTIICMVFVDQMIQINLIGFVPKEVLNLLYMSKVGLADFFSLLYLIYEAVSILKNMCALKLPVFKKFSDILVTFLEKYTGEKIIKEEGNDDKSNCS